MIFMLPITPGSSGIPAPPSVVMMTIGRLLSVKVCPFTGSRKIKESRRSVQGILIKPFPEDLKNKNKVSIYHLSSTEGENADHYNGPVIEKSDNCRFILY